MATYADAQAVKDRVPGRIYGSSQGGPSDSTITSWLDDAEGIVNGALQTIGLVTPITNANGVSKLKTMVVDYAEGRLRQSNASAAGDGSNIDGWSLLEKFDKEVEDILSDPSEWIAKLSGGSVSSANSRLRSYVTDNRDGLSVANGDFDPTFRKGDVL